MSLPESERRVLAFTRGARDGKETAPTEPRSPGRSPEALLRISPTGICLELVAFDRLATLESVPEVVGAHLSDLFGDDAGPLVAADIRAVPAAPRVREIHRNERRLRLEILPCRDGTSWIRLREPSEVAAHDSAPDGSGARSTQTQGRPQQAQFQLDPSGRIIRWGSDAAIVTGLTADAAVGRHLSELSSGSPAWADRVAQHMTEGPRDGVAFEEWLWRPDDRRTYLSVLVSLRTGGYRVTLRDATERRLRSSRAAMLYAVSRAALDAESVEDLTRRTLTAMCEALEWEFGVYWHVDTVAGVLRCRETVGLDGLPPLPNPGSGIIAPNQGLAGRVWHDQRADSGIDGFETHPVFAASAVTGQLRTGFAFPIQGSGGIFGVFEFASRAIEEVGPELLRTSAVIGHHISQFTDRLYAEAALRESDAHKAALLSTALDGLMTVDADGRIVELNAEALRTFDRNGQALVGSELASSVGSEADRAALRDKLAVLAQGEAYPEAPGCRLQVRALRTDGEEFPADLSITRVPLDGPPRFSICVRDLSDQERLQGALHHAQKMESLGLLASGIAHDFNNFLTVIRGQAERLIKHLPSEDAGRRWVSSILKVSERASALTGQLLAFGRREAGTVGVVDVNAIIESTANLLSSQLGKGVTWSAKLSADAGAARIGEGQVQQILFNLTLNARDAMPDGGTLEVGTAQVGLTPEDAARLLLPPGSYVSLWVRDTGRGMDGRTQSRVFEPFFTTKQLGEGTGLGLSTVYAIVQQCAGQITVVSRPGQGTTFTVYLPRVSSGAVSTSTTVPVTATSALAGLTVLLVEDESDIREIIRETLEQQGCRVIEAENGLIALERCAAHRDTIDLLVTDVMMPGMNGHELAERVARLRPDVPVVFVSGHPEAELGSNRVPGQRVSLLRKPFSSEDIVAHVLRMISHRQTGHPVVS